MKYDDYGRELPDDTPVEVPIKFKRPPSIQELIAMHVKSAMQVERAMGKGDDEDDFDEEQEIDDVLTPYELHAYAGEADAEFRKAKAAKDLVDKVQKRRESRASGGSDEKGTGRGSEVGKETSQGVGGPGSAGSADKAVGEAGRKVAGDDRGAS